MRASASSSADHRTVTARTSSSDLNHSPALLFTLHFVFATCICVHDILHVTGQQKINSNNNSTFLGGPAV